MKTYKELITIPRFEERYEYLKLSGHVGKTTFGFERYLNQTFYRSPEWRLTRRDAIARDEGCDLAIDGRIVYGRIIVHHINPITARDIELSAPCLFDLNNLICVSEETDRAIHYGDASLLTLAPIERTRGDTLLWKVSLQR